MFGLLSTGLVALIGDDGVYMANDVSFGAAALHASERDALMRKYGITSERDSAETCFKTTCCWWVALAQESREITIREQINDLYEPPEHMEMEQRFL
jgi:hypothetical protein